MKKLDVFDPFSDDDNLLDVERKINELVDFANFHKQWHEFDQPKKLEVKHDFVDPFEEFDRFQKYWGKDTQNVFCYTDKENEVIKKCLKYCRHRLSDAHFVKSWSGRINDTGINKALSCDDKKVFYKILKKI